MMETLSDKTKEWFCAQAELDVKEFIRELKESLINEGENGEEVTSIIHAIIDKLAGDKLI